MTYFCDHFEFSLKNSENRQYCFPKFLHEKSAYRKNKIYHDVADGKCHAMDTKNVFLDPSYGVKFLVQNQGFFDFLNFLKKGKMTILSGELHPLGLVQEYFLGVYYIAFSVGCVVVYFVFSVGAVFMEKFGRQYCLFSEFFKENSKWSQK